MIRICVIGDAHISPLKYLTADGAYLGPDVELTFLSANERLMSALALQGNALVPGTDALRSALGRDSSEQGLIDLDAFDQFLIVGLGLQIGHLVRLNKDFSSDSMPGPIGDRTLLSDPCFIADAQAVFTGCQSIRIARMIRSYCDRPITLVPHPNPAAGVPQALMHDWFPPFHAAERNGDAEALGMLFRKVLKRLSDAYSVRIVPPPREAAANGIFNRPEFSLLPADIPLAENAMRDMLLANHHYGAFLLRDIFGPPYQNPPVAKPAVSMPAVSAPDGAAEAVRLVIWDLDETFWRGTVTEGGIQEYVREHHDIVIELARRGIMSSICSKNDMSTILPILEQNGILEYFIFPSISWEPKGMRLAALVETVQLRAPTVMFIDDNPNNRAEAAAVVPGLQIESEHFIARMLADRRFRGKPDAELSRLKQYKLLETRKRDEQQAGGGDNAAFLRGCDIRVFIEYDVPSQIDRAIELINRTNQLNFTKKRLPENIEQARRMLGGEISKFNRQAGLVRVVDKYGDYGFVGFFETETGRMKPEAGAANIRLTHYCFSCRTLGMYIEQWLYEHLGRPELNVVGEVLTDLSVPRQIDWVQQVQAIGDDAPRLNRVAPEILLYGGCEAAAVGVYLGAHIEKLTVFGNYATDGLFVRVNTAAEALAISDRDPVAFAAEAKILGLPLHMSAVDLFAGHAPGTAFVFNCGRDARGHGLRFRHKTEGWTAEIEPPGMPDFVFTEGSSQILAERLAGQTYLTPEQRDNVLAIGRHMTENYVRCPQPTDAEKIQAMRELIARTPEGSKFIIALDHDEVRHDEKTVGPAPWISHYETLMRPLAAEYPYVGIVSFSDVVRGHEDIEIGGNHYGREIYLRMANRIVEVIGALPPKPAWASMISGPVRGKPAWAGTFGEPIRMVIWDLDETFWGGTLTEGGIAYSQANHDIVIELAKRGIVSAIVSKNDLEPVRRILTESGLWDYFVFPSVNWDAKGPRLKDLVEASGLRAETILFIDDNHLNRAEALHHVPELHVESEAVIPAILGHSMFQGKHDAGLTRLQQYKVLEQKQVAKASSSDNTEFLRASDIRVYIEYDVTANIDRAIELINRTNQLNFTKKRLPEDIEQARSALGWEIGNFNRQAGLVRVIDKYGDYGFVGFFVTETGRVDLVPGAANVNLQHFCFSCRTLGMYVEQWVYDYLGRPELKVEGEVLTDLAVPRRIDWIRQVPAIEADAQAQAHVAPEILLYGGCEANAVGVYLKAHAAKVTVYGNYFSNGLFLRINSAALALGICERSRQEFAAEAAILGLPSHLSAIDIFADVAPGAAYVFNCMRDSEGNLPRYRHKIEGWLFEAEPANMDGLKITETSDEIMAERFAAADYIQPETRGHLMAVCRHIRENYELCGWPPATERIDAMRELIARVPEGSKFIIALDHHETRWDDKIVPMPWVLDYAQTMRELASEYSYVGVVSFTEVIQGPDEIQIGGNHYNREVYWRMAERIVEVIGETPAKTTWSRSINEPIRMVIWDLDETFWRGTLTEGGIAYRQANHDIVIELAKRGIVSAIVSKNDLEPVRRILTESGLWDYFVFPSVNWDAKGPRLKDLVEASGLRAETILFIDDNHLNRAEALHHVPELHVESEAVIPAILGHPMFQGKDDSELTRLQQYKVLEQKQVAKGAAADNLAFLRSSNIVVSIEFDVETHIDRAIELINRTNQLNFTKLRLPDDAEAARSALRAALHRGNTYAGLVRVRDKYGDYGFVGFYLEFEWQLEYFCFSCRTLGMGIESWLFDRLERPRIHITDPVVTDLRAPRGVIDWISLESHIGPGSSASKSGRILVRGTCESQSLVHYLAVDDKDIVGEFYLSHTAFNDAALLGLTPERLRAAQAIGYRKSNFESKLIENPGSFDAIVLTLWDDVFSSIYRHRDTGLVLPFRIHEADNGRDLRELSEEEIDRYTRNTDIRTQIEALRREYEYLGNSLYPIGDTGISYFEKAANRLLDTIPLNIPVFTMLACSEYVDQSGVPQTAYHLETFNQALRKVTAGRQNVILIDVRDAFDQPEDIVDIVHFNRMVYYRLYQLIFAKWAEWKSNQRRAA